LTRLPDQPISLQRDAMQTIKDQQASGRMEICNSISGALISDYLQYIIYKQALQMTISIMSDEKVSKMMLQCSN